MHRLDPHDLDNVADGFSAAAKAVDYSAHPGLDPNFAERPSRLLRFLEMTHDRIRNDDEAYRCEAGRLFMPFGPRDGDTEAIDRVGDYLREADVYLRELTDLLPHGAHGYLQQDLSVSDCNDMRDLLTIIFGEGPARTRFEAQRKLYLATLLINIDQSRHIQVGQKYKVYFEELLQTILWQHTRQAHDLEIGYHIDADGDSIRYTSRPAEGDNRWRFHSIFLEKMVDDRKIALDILYYSCRFKRGVDPVTWHEKDGHRQVTEKKRWRQMQRRSNGSILSKMIRRGVNNPDQISDLVGAMFIVTDEDALNDLLAIFDASIGSPFFWRNVTDTVARPEDREQLNPQSGRGYKVFKGDMDIVYRPSARRRVPYRVPVEVQIYTLEGFLRTVCGQHEASHQALKQRQFLYGLVPKIFPRSLYGSNWLRLD